jgi:hypothetical protein
VAPTFVVWRIEASDLFQGHGFPMLLAALMRPYHWLYFWA